MLFKNLIFGRMVSFSRVLYGHTKTCMRGEKNNGVVSTKMEENIEQNSVLKKMQNVTKTLG